MKLKFEAIPIDARVTSYQRHVAVIEEQIKEGNRQNTKLQVYENERTKRKDTLTALIAYRMDIDKVMKITQDAALKYRNDRIKFLEKEIEKNLEFLLPEEKFKVKIDFRTISDRHYADLLIGDGITWSSPKSKNGRFIRQVISFTAMYSVNKLRGSKTLFYDEALSSADATSLTELKELMWALMDEGFQIIMVEHKEQIYNSLDRKEIHLHKDRDKGNVKILREEIIDGEPREHGVYE